MSIKLVSIRFAASLRRWWGRTPQPSTKVSKTSRQNNKGGLMILLKAIGNHGVMNAIYQLSLRLVNKVVAVNILTCLVITRTSFAALELDKKFQHGFLGKSALLAFSQDVENQLSEQFIKSATQKGDECYAITENGQLAAYGWYSKGGTVTDIQQLKFCFDSAYMYMYKGFTRVDYRGQRLHAVGMSWALHYYLSKGFSGIISYVESTNFDSLKSCYRMGYQNAGSIIVIKLFGRVYYHASRSCQKYDIRMSAAVADVENPHQKIVQ